MNGVVGVTAIDENGNLQSEAGQPLALPQTTVVAAGFDLPSVGVLGDWNGTAARTGSSNSAPIVAAMLALAAQKYPEATGNQLVHSLIATTNGEVKERCSRATATVTARPGCPLFSKMTHRPTPMRRR